jgi:hypothetical protein
MNYAPVRIGGQRNPCAKKVPAPPWFVLANGAMEKRWFSIVPI